MIGLTLAFSMAGALPSQSPIMKNSGPAPGASAPKNELQVDEPEGSTTPPTLRIVIALLLVAAVVAVVVVPSRKGGGDTR